ncbi:MAG: GNAT family N-acetyltransferase [Bdellovibrionales bacterium]|nr:GNAT family N-acetyltransferase [Bdellovibrionales bacterium]
MKSAIQLREISFAQILPVWSQRLWPGRKSEIEPASIIDHTGRLSLDLRALNPIFFWGAFDSGDTSGGPLGVISGFPTSGQHFRCRGLWVDPLMRDLGIGSSLVQKSEEAAQSLNRSVLWTMPRLSALPFYLKYGFKEQKWVSDFEFGPHALVEKTLSLTLEESVNQTRP